MTLKLGINGFGRIGRCVFRAAMHNPEIEIVVVNNPSFPEKLYHFLKYDTVHGILPEEIKPAEGGFTVDGKFVRVVSDRNPANINWGEMGVDIVMECTGKLNSKEAVLPHLNNGAKKVVITAPAKNEDATIVFGINEHTYDPAKHQVVSCASCTTNCLAPVAKILLKEFGIVKGMMTTVHAFTNDQRVLDHTHKDFRRARTASASIIPTTTGAAKAVAKVLPELEGKLTGMAMRVPVPNVSVVDLVVETGRKTTVEEVNAALKAASEGELKGILEYCEEPLVSVDFNGNKHSSIVDALSTLVVQDNLVKVIAWYDNEMGYSYRVVDIALYLYHQGL